MVFVQAGSMVTSVMSEQLEAEFKRDELILKNKLTAAEAEKEAQEWEQVSTKVSA